ncbi:hypothetical protein CAPTEDRAFT_192493 [Capitella teleta]|uniref:Uncharacterized protein n=1 Tax=Capitella teleta TaxID=283909 RepID=R7UAV4_CAPTE|nr:hypothetical protein CAPTEDRAFT_192493 [Capitella teleta]|eukprot:ELU00397.1 hypothetical protein CAPTEDRAFT_192493 [Capitella teleta]
MEKNYLEKTLMLDQAMKQLSRAKEVGKSQKVRKVKLDRKDAQIKRLKTEKKGLSVQLQQAEEEAEDLFSNLMPRIMMMPRVKPLVLAAVEMLKDFYLSSNKGATLHQDSTTKFHQQFEGIQVTLQNGRQISIGLRAGYVCCINQGRGGLAEEQVVRVPEEPDEQPSPDLKLLNKITLELITLELLVLVERQASSQLPEGKYWNPSKELIESTKNVPKTIVMEERNMAVLNNLLHCKVSISAHNLETTLM